MRYMIRYISYNVKARKKKSDIQATVSQLVPEYPSVHEHEYSSECNPSLQVAGYLHGELMQASCKEKE